MLDGISDVIFLERNAFEFIGKAIGDNCVDNALDDADFVNEGFSDALGKHTVHEFGPILKKLIIGVAPSYFISKAHDIDIELLYDFKANYQDYQDICIPDFYLDPLDVFNFVYSILEKIFDEGNLENAQYLINLFLMRSQLSKSLMDDGEYVKDQLKQRTLTYAHKPVTIKTP